jgi:hypothetical protein
MRARRGLVAWAVVAATAAALLLMFGGPWRSRIINPGGLSLPHSSGAFAAMAGGATNSDAACRACHVAGDSGPGGMMRAAFFAEPGPLEIHKLHGIARTDMTAIDDACRKCHESRGANYLFHQPNVVRDHSCSLCHQEHTGAGAMKPPTDANCSSCHGEAAVMAASAEKGRNLPASAFDIRPDLGRRLFKTPRPAEGFTKVFRSFAGDHPEFRVHADRLRDGNTLKFGHALHLTSDTIPALPDGRRLKDMKDNCAFCHKPDAAGAYFQPFNFEQHCRVCHSLQFDPETPELTLPHGNPEFVASFLRSLPKQYSDYAARQPGLGGADAQRRWVEQKLAGLRQRIQSGEALEQRVFFSTATFAPGAQVSTVSGATRALYPGCAYCHEVMSEAGRVAVTRPMIPDRWLVRGEFVHSKHAQMECRSCHAASASKETADIILPTKASCTSCHSPHGGVRDNCSTCHSYHTSRGTAASEKLSAR